MTLLYVPRPTTASAGGVSNGPSHHGSPHQAHAAALAAMRDKTLENEHQQGLYAFGVQLYANLREDRLAVAKHPSAVRPTLVVMNTGLRLMDPTRNVSAPLQVRFDLDRSSIQLVSGGSVIDLNIRRYAPLVEMLLAKIEAKLSEENKLGQELRSAMEKKVGSGALPQGMQPSSISKPTKLSTGGYEFQVTMSHIMKRADGSDVQSSAHVVLQTDEKGVPCRFVSAVKTEDRPLAGSRICSGAGPTYLSDPAAQRSLKGQLQAMFPEEYQAMGVR